MSSEERVRELLAEVYLPEGVDLWMSSRNRNLRMQIPALLLAAGKGDEVLAEVERLVGGAW